MQIFFILFVNCCLLFYTNIAYALQSDWSGIEESKVRIISPLSKVGDNSTIYLGLEYQLQKGWKTYWRSPGEGGFPQKLDISASKNISKLEVLWPTPKEFEILGFKSIGYENEVIFPLKINIKNVNSSVNLLLDLNFLTCKDICVPGQASLQLNLPTGKAQLTKHAFKLEKYLSKVPFSQDKKNELEITNVVSYIDKNLTSINIKARSNTPFESPKFFLDSNFGLPVITPKYSYSVDRNNIEANFSFEKSLFIDDEFDLTILLKDKNNAIEYQSIVKQQNKKNLLFFINQSYFYIIGIALFGGLILNIMPCVLPVLSIKLLSILTKKQTSLTSIRKSFLMTSIGIISSFLFLAFILIILKLSGTSIGWGMQFQQPLFLMVIALILFLFSLNLFGFFEIYVPRRINDLFKNHFFNNLSYKDYFNGVFATILATPCSAPFVGTAVTLAFTQSILIMISIFFFMGIGMALPFLLAVFFPKIIHLLPKPGSWTNIIKYILGFMLLGTLVWIGTILENHFNYFFIIISIFLALLILLNLIFIHRKRSIIIFCIIIVFFSLNLFPFFEKNFQKFEDDWQDLTKVNIINLINKNNIVFVDITADWCATCQFNKINILNSKLIKNVFKDNKVIKVKGDWTKPNKKIQEFLNSYNRFGIPFNVIYNQSNPNGIILSELLTSKEIINTIEKLN